MPGIGVILNPHSKKHRLKPQRIERMGFIVGDRASFRLTKDLDELAEVTQEFKARQLDIVAIGGGDGTMHCTLTKLMQSYGTDPLPKIVFLRGGTLNTIATSMGVYGSSERILSSLMIKYHEGLPFKEKTTRVMLINGECGFLFGFGVIYRFMEAYYGHGEGSPWRAAWTLVRSIGSALCNGPFAMKQFARTDGRITVDGKSWPFQNFSAVYAGRIAQLGLNFRVFYLAEKQEDRFHLVGFSLPPRHVLSYVPKMYLGKPCGCESLLEAAAGEAIIEMAEPVPYTIDGDLKEPVSRFEIKMGPELKLIIP